MADYAHQIQSERLEAAHRGIAQRNRASPRGGDDGDCARGTLRASYRFAAHRKRRKRSDAYPPGGMKVGSNRRDQTGSPTNPMVDMILASADEEGSRTV